MPNVLEVTPSFPAKTVSEFIAYAKANPGKVSYASAGNGTSAHLAAELFRAMTGVDFVHVPYRGSGPALTDLPARSPRPRLSGVLRCVPVDMGAHVARYDQRGRVGCQLARLAIGSWRWAVSIIRDEHGRLVPVVQPKRWQAASVRRSRDRTDRIARARKQRTVLWGSAAERCPSASTTRRSNAPSLRPTGARSPSSWKSSALPRQEKSRCWSNIFRWSARARCTASSTTARSRGRAVITPNE